MEKIQSVTPIEADGAAKPRPWLRAVFSGAVFGGLGAAAMHWLAYHSTSIENRAKASLGRNWMSGVAGVASGVVAMYGTLRAEDAPPRSVFEVPSDTPGTAVNAASAQRDDVVAPAAQRAR